MKIEQIKNIAKQQGILVGKMKKSDIIKAIQLHEGNSACYGAGIAAQCGQQNCAWREDCA